MNYTEKVTRLEEILKLIEGTPMSLEESLKLYDEAQKLVADCRKFLKSAEKKVKKLEDDGSLSDFPDLEA